MENKSNTGVNVKRLTEQALIIAIIVLMAFTPLGYISTPIIKLTLITIPVAVGAMFLGPKGGAVSGLTFGLTSVYAALTSPSPMMAAFMMVSPVKCIILCVVPRILEGFLCGLIFEALKKGLKGKAIAYYIGGISCPVLNTILFMGTVVLFFYNCDYVNTMKEALGVGNPIAFIIAAVGVQAAIEAVCCGLASGVVTHSLSKILSRS